MMRRQTIFAYRRLALALLLAVLLGAGAALAQTGGGYDLSWGTVDGGGGSGTGGSYQLSGSIGQPDASAASSGGGYSLSGGFWAEAPAANSGAGDADKIYLPLLQR